MGSEGFEPEGKEPDDLAEQPTLDGAGAAPTRPAPGRIVAHRSEGPSPVDAGRPEAVTPEAQDRYDPDARELGRGGIGRVLAVFDRHLGRRVAIKELLPAATGVEIAESDRVRFLREARVTGQLEHPNIVPVYELGRRDDGTLYYSMKIVRGRTLRKALRQAETLQARLRLLPHYVDLANAIAYAHSRGVVHRDIKPDNVMLGEFGETIVLDWGLTKVRGEMDPVAGATVRRQRALLDSDVDSATRAGDVLGTPAYMSPEQAAGDVENVDELSDVWSLGAVLFELLTGNPPFRGARAAETLYRVAEGAVPRVADVEPRAPRDLAAVAEKALAKNREHRYPDARSLVADVEAFMTGQRVGAYEYTALELLKKFIIEHRAAASAIFSIVLVILIGGVLTFAAYRQALAEQARAEAAEQRALAAKEASEVNERKASENLSNALYEKSKLLADEREYGSAAVYAAGALGSSPWVESNHATFPDLDARDPQLRAEQVLPLRSAMYESLVGLHVERRFSLRSDEVCGFDLSDDGRLVAASSRDGFLTLWDLEARAPRWRLEAPDCPRYLDIDPQGRWIAFTDVAEPVSVVDIEGRTRREVQLTSPEAWMVHFSRDGRSLFVAGSQDELARVSTRDWKVRDRTRVEAPRAIAVSPDGQRIAVGNRWGSVYVVDAQSFRVLNRHSDHGSTVYAVAFSPDNRRLASAGFEGIIVVRGLRDDASPPLRLEQGTSVRDLAWLRDRLFAVGNEVGRLWSVDDGIVEQVVRRHPQGIRQVRAGPGGSTLVTAGYGADIDAWTVRDGVDWRVPHPGHLFATSISANGRWLATLDETARIRWWNASTRSLQWTAHEPTAWDVEFAGDRLLSITSRGVVKSWSSDGRPRVLQPEIPERQDSYVDLAVDAEGRRAAWVAGRGRVVVYDLAADRVLAEFDELAAQSVSVSLSSDGRRLAGADDRGNLMLWDLAAGMLWSVTEAHDGIITGLSFSRDGRFVISAGRDARVRWWDATTGAPVDERGSHGDWVNDVIASDDGRYLLTASDDRTARLWDAERREPLLELRSLSEDVQAVAFDRARDLMIIGLDQTLVGLPLDLPQLEWSPQQLRLHAEQASGLALDGVRLVASRPPAGPRVLETDRP